MLIWQMFTEVTEIEIWPIRQLSVIAIYSLYLTQRPFKLILRKNSSVFIAFIVKLFRADVSLLYIA